MISGRPELLVFFLFLLGFSLFCFISWFVVIVVVVVVVIIDYLHTNKQLTHFVSCRDLLTGMMV
ncbi:hypothetical protein BDV37DRAFT_247569, partial [Aspergillus pseudonomiae]